VRVLEPQGGEQLALREPQGRASIRTVEPQSDLYSGSSTELAAGRSFTPKEG